MLTQNEIQNAMHQSFIINHEFLLNKKPLLDNEIYKLKLIKSPY